MKPTESQRAAGRASCAAAGLTCDETVPARRPPDTKTVNTVMRSPAEVADDLEAALKRNGKTLSADHRKAFTKLLDSILAGEKTEADESDDEEAESAPAGVFDTIVKGAVDQAMRNFAQTRASAAIASDNAPRTAYVDLGAILPGAACIGGGDVPLPAPRRTANDSAPAMQAALCSAVDSGQALRNAIPGLGNFTVLDPRRSTAARAAPRAARDGQQQAMRRELARSR